MTPAAAYEPTVPPWLEESLEHPPGLPPPPSAPPPSAPPEEAPADETSPQTVSNGIKVSADHHVKLLFSSTEEDSTFTCRLDSHRAFSCESPLVLRHLQPGPHKVTVAAIDSVGNTDPTPVRFHFRVEA